jgi:hypothetical protein
MHCGLTPYRYYAGAWRAAYPARRTAGAGLGKRAFRFCYNVILMLTFNFFITFVSQLNRI